MAISICISVFIFYVIKGTNSFLQKLEITLISGICSNYRFSAFRLGIQWGILFSSHSLRELLPFSFFSARLVKKIAKNSNCFENSRKNLPEWLESFTVELFFPLERKEFALLLRTNVQNRTVEQKKGEPNYLQRNNAPREEERRGGASLNWLL